jgi:hypothetical protein
MRSVNPQFGSPRIVLRGSEARHIGKPDRVWTILALPWALRNGTIFNCDFYQKAADGWSRYYIPYLRHLLRSGRLKGIDSGQVWLISLVSLEVYLSRGHVVRDGRHGPKKDVTGTREDKTI